LVELRRTIDAWFSGVVQRTVPKTIIPEGVNFEEASMLEENLIRWSERIRKEALREGLREGRKEGRQKRREGQLDGMRKVLLQQMTLRFGRLPKEVRSRVEQINSAQEMQKLSRKVLSAKSLEEMGLG
jgi:flagellar biosynthesis/type III secretory pathway protein FliH